MFCLLKPILYNWSLNNRKFSFVQKIVLISTVNSCLFNVLTSLYLIIAKKTQINYFPSHQGDVISFLLHTSQPAGSIIEYNFNYFDFFTCNLFFLIHDYIFGVLVSILTTLFQKRWVRSPPIIRTTNIFYG